MVSQADRSEATRAALVAAGRVLFAERGYADVSVGELVNRAGVTSGALYHQFGSKERLFRAVYGELVQSVAEGILAERSTDSERDLVADCEAYLDACVDPAFHRITLVDGPAVLGWDTIRDGAQVLVQASLAAAQKKGQIPEQPLEPLARMLVAALKEAGVMIATADDPKQARADAGESVRYLIGGLLI